MKKTDFHRGAVKPMACLREGWRLIRDDYWLFFGISLVGALLAGMGPMGMLVGPALCGIHLCLLRREHGLPVTFDMLFQGFNYFAQSLIASLILVGVTIFLVFFSYALIAAAVFGTIALMAPQGPGGQLDPVFVGVLIGVLAVLMLLILLVFMVLQGLFLFTYPLIVDRELPGFEAVKVSWRAMIGNFTGVMGLVFLATFLSFLGVLFCYVGAFFFLPISYAMAAVAYRQVFPQLDAGEETSPLPDDDTEPDPFSADRGQITPA